MQASDSSDTLSMLRESAADFVRGSTDFKRLRERRGTLPGYDPSLARQMADLGWFGILVPEGRFVALEVKAPNGKGPTPEQERFLELVRRSGGFAAVVRSVSDAREAVSRARLGDSK